MQWHEFRSHIRHLSTLDLARIEQGFVLGKKMHDGQLRKSGEPYFSHPIAVALMLAEMHADADTIIAALLHDTVEDTPLTLHEIDEQFHGTVAMIIDGLTKLAGGDIPSNPKLDEQIESMRKIFTLMEQDVRIMVVKLVDRLHNMQTIEFLSPQRQMALARETQDVYVKIADKLCMQDLRDELLALCLSVLEPDLYSALTALRMNNEERGAVMIDMMKKTLWSHDPVLVSRMSLGYESKTWDQLRTQMTEGSTVRTGQSFISIAFICDDIDTCYRTLGALHQHWQREVLSFQDFINAPQLNGYRGLHTTLITEDGTRIRCKIRTCDMHTYARHGIVMKCFDSKALGVQDYLPWTKRITPLTIDTEGSSTDFWQSLQSDILGETITIHGPGDTTFQLPKGSTALDGAFYVMQENALQTESILVNGIESSFDAILTNAASIQINVSKQRACKREWLSRVNTTLATVIIRSALMEISEKEKVIIGRQLLQKVFTDHKRGYIDEVNESTLQSSLNALGYPTLQSVFIAIADGRLEPTSVYMSLFAPRAKMNAPTFPISIVRYTIELSSEVMDRINLIHRKFGVSLIDIRYHRLKQNKMIVTLTVRLSPKELSTLQSDILKTGGTSLSVSERSYTLFFLLFGVIILWGLNPVIARWFLLQGVQPLALVTVRFFTFFAYTGIFYVGWRLFSRVRYTRIPHLFFLSSIPAVGLIGMSVFNYLALTVVPASLHLTILRLNTLLLPLSFILQRSVKWTAMRFVPSILFIALIILMMSVPGAPPFYGILLSSIALGSYMLYTLSSEHLLQQKKISERYPVFAMHIGLFLGIAGLLLVPWQHADALINFMTMRIVFYVLTCVCLPHFFYSMLLKRMRFTHFTDIQLLEVPFAIGFEFLLLGHTLSFPLYFIITMTLGVLLFHRWKKLSSKIII